MMAADCETWLNTNPVESEELSDSYQSGNEERGLVSGANDEISGNWVPAPTGTVHEARLKAKAKRRLRKNSSRDSGRGDSLSENGDASRSAAPPSSPKGKVLDRRSRLGKGRGLPKKGGAGGKGVWGTPGEVYDEEQVDVRDPNYDEDQELLGELNLGSLCSEVPFLAVSLALEAKASQRELTSFLLSRLCGRVLSRSDIEASFHKLLKELPELVLDTPTAPQLVGQFIARAVADQILSKSYIDGYKGRVDCEHARAALDRAAVLLKMNKESGLKIDNLWGSGGGQRPVNQLIKEVNLLLKEYVLSGDTAEAERCLRELEVPHFHHEFVYEAIVMVLESKGDTALQAILKLLKSLFDSTVITLDQMRRGYERVYMDIADINIDVPCAYAVLEHFVDKSFGVGVIDKKLRDLCPCRGRKRFVSEGDGGLLKPDTY
ncbi:programmed cell death protein 4b isoform X2 [Tachysurus fulvidraco]|uniref:programmed cell death protein 4b isoform X2 n=1 Tax=Tachysurus fulvidraco TaxID=1234273 RepID=UPI001FEF78D8|nr:programmed cell death protein 4b isoform X2 [Tachysurus fulvidraco]